MISLLSKPDLGSDTLTARYYQIEALEAVRREFKAGIKRTMVVLPTASGKTVLFSKISRATVEKGGRVLILAHLGDLVHQAADVLERVGIIAGIEKAELYARASFDPDVVVGTVQTFRGKRLASWDPGYFKLVIRDECHHSTSDTDLEILNHFSGARVLGVTATPDRADGKSLMDIFQSVAYERTIWEMMTAPAPGPYLSRLEFIQRDAGIDLRNIKTTGEDYNDEDIKVAITPHIELLANLIKEETVGRSTLVFTPDVGSAQAMATALQSLGLSAEWIAGDSADRDEKARSFKTGETQMLCNCHLFCEGVDAPITSAIALCRPTKSRSLFTQMVGRGLRLYPGKQNCRLIDFNFLTTTHELVRPVDLFDNAGIAPDILDAAHGRLQNLDDTDLLAAIESAREDIEEKERTRRVISLSVQERKVKCRRVSYDPLSIANVLGMKFKTATEAVFVPPTDAQCDYAKRKGIQNPEIMSKRRLSRLLDFDSKRRAKGLATIKQVNFMMSLGIKAEEARKMTIPQASETINRIQGKVAV